MAQLWEIVPAGFETAHYRAPDGEAEFEVAVAVYGGEPLRRGGKDVVSVWSGSIRWVGDRCGQAISEADHDRVLVPPFASTFAGTASPTSWSCHRGRSRTSAARAAPVSSPPFLWRSTPTAGPSRTW